MEETKNMTVTEETEAQQGGGLSEKARANRLVILTKAACAKAIHADDRALELWQQGKLSSELFAKITGHLPEDALQMRYIESRVNASFPLRRQVAAGGISQEEYEAATNSPYVSDMEALLSEAVDQLLGGIGGVPAINPEPQPEAAAENGDDITKGENEE